MLHTLRRGAALATVAGAVGVAATAVAAGPAFASYQLRHGSSDSSPNASLNTSYTATTDSNGVKFTNSAGTTTYISCPSGSLGGVTVDRTGSPTSGGAATGLNITGASFSSCNLYVGSPPTAIPVSFDAITSPAWVAEPTGGSSPGPFTGTISKINVTLHCGSNSTTYTGTLGTGFSFVNVVGSASGGSKLVLTNAAQLTKPAGGCATPGTLDLTATYILRTVGGTTTSLSNNLWETGAPPL